MFVAIENEEEFINFIKNIGVNQSKMMDVKLRYTIDKKSDILNCIPIIKDLQNIALDYYSHEVIVKCNCVCLFYYFTPIICVQIIFGDCVVDFYASGYTRYVGNREKYKKEIECIKTIINQLYGKN